MKKILTLALLITAIIAVVSISAEAQKNCGKKQDDEKYEQTFQNASDKTITVRIIDEKCAEKTLSVKPGKLAKYNSVYTGYRFIANVGGVEKEYTAAYSNYIITIGAVESDDAKESFIETVNQFRHGNNLAPMEFDERLNKAAQWFADLLAKYDSESGHDAVEVGGDEYADMKEVEQRTTHFGWKGVVAEVVAGDNLMNMPGKNAIGGAFAVGWAASTTHYAPFFDIGEHKFNRVGFGSAESSKTKGKYYAVALFGIAE